MCAKYVIGRKKNGVKFIPPSLKVTRMDAVRRIDDVTKIEEHWKVVEEGANYLEMLCKDETEEEFLEYLETLGVDACNSAEDEGCQCQVPTHEVGYIKKDGGHTPSLHEDGKTPTTQPPSLADSGNHPPLSPPILLKE